MIRLPTKSSTIDIMRRSEPPLRHAFRRVKQEKQKVINASINMDLSFPGILRESRGPESSAFVLASYPPFQPKIQCYLTVESDPQACCNYILASSAFQRKSKDTLKRLAFSPRLSIRYAAEFEIIRREIIEHFFPGTYH